MKYLINKLLNLRSIKDSLTLANITIHYQEYIIEHIQYDTKRCLYHACVKNIPNLFLSLEAPTIDLLIKDLIQSLELIEAN
jgi:hypothetical protein